jgi:hypothetical protein
LSAACWEEAGAKRKQKEEAENEAEAKRKQKEEPENFC